MAIIIRIFKENEKEFENTHPQLKDAFIHVNHLRLRIKKVNKKVDSSD